MEFTAHQKAFAAAIFSFIFWGLSPLYFKLINNVEAATIIAHRVIWGTLFLAVFLIIRERAKFFKTLKIPMKTLMGLLLSGVLIISNWLIFVWAVTNDQILATSLGYFINPLVNILLGTLFLKERLNKTQIIALILAASSTVYLGFYLGQPPWIAIALAITFGLYALTRKLLEVRPLVGLFWESTWLIVPAFMYLFFVSETTVSVFSFTYTLLIFSGLVTVLPLISFNYAAKGLSLTLIGFLQYMAPTISFIIAVIFYNEVFTHGHQVAFAGIWAALFIISFNTVKSKKKRLPLTDSQT